VNHFDFFFALDDFCSAKRLRLPLGSEHFARVLFRNLKTKFKVLIGVVVVVAVVVVVVVSADYRIELTY